MGEWEAAACWVDWVGGGDHRVGESRLFSFLSRRLLVLSLPSFRSSLRRSSLSFSRLPWTASFHRQLLTYRADLSPSSFTSHFRVSPSPPSPLSSPPKPRLNPASPQPTLVSTLVLVHDPLRLSKTFTLTPTLATESGSLRRKRTGRELWFGRGLERGFTI